MNLLKSIFFVHLGFTAAGIGRREHPVTQAAGDDDADDIYPIRDFCHSHYNIEMSVEAINVN